MVNIGKAVSSYAAELGFSLQPQKTNDGSDLVMVFYGGDPLHGAPAGHVLAYLGEWEAYVDRFPRMSNERVGIFATLDEGVHAVIREYRG